MFEVGFSELLLICAIALIVLGPQRLPKLAAQIGRWMGRARSMARQFREQLEDEAFLEETRHSNAAAARNGAAVPTPPASVTAPSGAQTIAPAASTPGALATAGNTGLPSTLVTGIPPDDDFAHHDLPEAPTVEPADDRVEQRGPQPAATEMPDAQGDTAPRA
ncbi:MAG: Sec-independent protein translocase protein TatB [Steroidobacteraceae bacterium]|nr:Sec-independent protein translocase protein TatB [Steroidobacteraceae bacterium]MDW8259244.1 Sec-independent protein translocase protein TatB [Gammaproteobacteria bacterium]